MALFGAVPPGMKMIQPYLKIAEDHDKKDNVIAYWCRLYAVQVGLKLNEKNRESSAFLFSIMDWLEKVKKENPENEALTNEIVAQAHIENHALQIFQYADNEDRSGRFHKNVVKAFYTAGYIYDVVSIFGEATEEVARQKKYAKWKSTYIHNCLKNGITPVPGPIAMEGEGEGSYDDESDPMFNSAGVPSSNNFNTPDLPGFNTGQPFGFNAGQLPDLNSASFSSSQAPYPTAGLFSNPGFQPMSLVPPVPGAHAPPTTPNGSSQASPSSFYEHPPKYSGDVTLQPEDFHRAQKFCKFAGSALQYEDVPTAVDNLQKALLLLTTGKVE